jgi:glycosyltransferase involved in cell wall biosynthesis
MNLLYVSDSPTLSGAEVVLLGHLAAFRPPNYTTHVLLRASNRRLAAALDRQCISYTTTGDFSVTPVRTTASPSALRQFVRSFVRVSSQIAGIIRAREIDLVHTVMYPAVLHVALACRRASCSQVWHEHNIKHVHAVNRPIYRWAARTCDRVIGPSHAVTTALAQAGIPPQKITTVYNGIDLDRFRIDDARAAAVRRELGLAPEQPAIALSGQMLPYKGHITLIDALPTVIRHFPTLRVFFVGARENPPYEAELTARVAAHGLGTHVAWTGWREDVAHVLRAMSVVVVPTLTPEPAALSLMETMAMGRPVIGSRTGGTPEIIEDGISGLVFPPGRSDVLAERLLLVLGDRALADRLGYAGQQRVTSRFSLDRHVREIEDLYAACGRTGGRQ